MSEPGTNPHTAEPAEGAEQPGSGEGGQTPHPEEPAEGSDVREDVGEGADTPDV